MTLEVDGSGLHLRQLHTELPFALSYADVGPEMRKRSQQRKKQGTQPEITGLTYCWDPANRRLNSPQADQLSISEFLCILFFSPSTLGT